MQDKRHVASATYHRIGTGKKVEQDSLSVRLEKRAAWVAIGGHQIGCPPRKIKVHQDELTRELCHRAYARCEWLDQGKCGWFGDKLETRLSKKTGKPNRQSYLRTMECMSEKAPRKGSET